MDAKLDKISELSNILCEKESLGQKIVAVSHEFGLGKRMTRISLQELTDFAKQKHPKSCVTKSWDGDVYV